MYSLLTGSLLISLLHALIPNHWLPVLAIGKKEGWTLAETSRITLIAGLAHVVSTILIGVILGVIGNELADKVDHFTHIIGPSILVLMGVYFIRQHYRHHHFHLEEGQIKKKSKSAIIWALVVAMFLSPCMEIEAYFLLAGGKGWTILAAIAGMYAVISIGGMLRRNHYGACINRNRNYFIFQ